MSTFKRICLVLCLCVIGAQVSAKPFEYQTEIDDFYHYDREGEPLWIEGEKLNEKGALLHQYLKNAWHHGLNPDQYNINHENLEPLQIELLLTQAYIKYARDLSGMRIKPSAIGLDPNHWKKPITIKQALENLRDNQKPFKMFLKNLAPQTQTYKALKTEMSIKPSIQLALNMERLRWFPDKKPERFIIVNIPSARLWAVENGQAKFEMPVIIGRKDRPTPSFITDIHGVRFNPTWTIPRTIKEKDIWPKLKENPKYLIDKGIELYEDNQTLDPTIIEWDAITRAQLHKFRMVQLPGKTNPLGRIRILMPNKYAIFLHDTSEAGFSDLERSYSSGCVRLKDPEKAARFILQKDITKFTQNTDTRDVYINKSIPVYLLYHTVWLGDKQRITYGKDIYGYDKKLRQVIEKYKGFPVF